MRSMRCEPDKRNIKLTLSYDGTDFYGWQKQKRREDHSIERYRTVQGVLENALETIHKEPVVITGSGRTDTGVHAAGQVANFYTSIKSIEAARFVPALNSLLPRDVRVLDACDTSGDFHARFDAKKRTYRYFFITRREILPWELRYAWNLRYNPDIRRLNEYARLLKGEMDCTAFAVPGDKSKSRHRYLERAYFFYEGDKLVFEISANAFLWKMVRSIAGTMIRFDQKGLSPGYLKKVIDSGSRVLTGPTAPPEGLFLWTIDY